MTRMLMENKKGISCESKSKWGYVGDFAVYRKGELVVMGSKKECADFLGVTEEYIHWMTTPTGIKRRNNRKNPEMAMAAVKLDEDDEAISM